MVKIGIPHRQHALIRHEIPFVHVKEQVFVVNRTLIRSVEYRIIESCLAFHNRVRSFGIVSGFLDGAGVDFNFTAHLCYSLHLKIVGQGVV
jgi:hypothetical protein